MKGLGVLGEPGFGAHVCVVGGLDFYFSESFPQAPSRVRFR